MSHPENHEVNGSALSEYDLLFISSRIPNLPYDKLTREQNEFCDLIEGDAPLTPEVRSEVAGVLRAFYAGMSVKQWRRWEHRVRELGQFLARKRGYQLRGAKAYEAEAKAAADLGYTREAMLKRIYRIKQWDARRSWAEPE